MRSAWLLIRPTNSFMRETVLILGVSLATAFATAGFFLLVVRRRILAHERGGAVGWFFAFALLVLAIPAAGIWLLPGHSMGAAALVVIGWGVALRGTAWFAARKFLAPRAGESDEPPQ